jgi:hypothetical protein
MKRPLMFLTLFSVGAEDGSPRDVTTVLLIDGPLLIDGFQGHGIHTANQHLVPNANLIFVGQQLRIPIGA